MSIGQVVKQTNNYIKKHETYLLKQNTKMTNIIIKMKVPIPIRIKYVFIESSLVFAPEKNHIFPATVKEVKQIVEYSYT